jgi:hypothetical protein
MPRFLTRTHTEDLTTEHTRYTVPVEGSVDPFNEEIIIENTGAHVLESPVVTVNDRYDWSTVEKMAEEITRGCTTDEEKALAIFNWVRTNGDHQYSGDIQSLNPVLLFNVYAYGICSYFASAQTGLARALGLDARVWEIYRYTVGEIFYDGHWHLLDPDMQLFYLDKDNRTIAAIEDLEKDPDFYALTQAYQRTFEDAYGQIRHQHQSLHDTCRYDLKHPRFVQYDYDPYIYANWTMDYALHPGERISRRWKGNGKHNDYRDKHRFKFNEEEPHKTWPPVQYGNGTVSYRFDPHRLDHLDIRNVTVVGDDLIVEQSQNSGDGSRSHVIYRRPLPYLIVGGRVRGEAFREGQAAYDLVNMIGYKQTNSREKQNLYVQETPGRHHFDIDLDDFLYPEKNHYAYEHGIQVLLSAYADHQPTVNSGLTSLEVDTEFQVQPRSLPALSLGKNNIEIHHKTPSDKPFAARVTHIWTERHGIRVAKPPHLIRPLDDVSLTAAGITFAWEGHEDARSYRFQLSLHHQCLFPLSPNFDVDLKDHQTNFHVEASWFNPDTTYYWRVQAKSRHDIWGPWRR